MPEIISSVMVHDNEPIGWTINPIPDSDGWLAETTDGNIGIGGSLDAVMGFAVSLYQVAAKARNEVTNGKASRN